MLYELHAKHVADEAMTTDEQFVEKLGRFFEAEGAPRTAGRILGLMLLTSGELALDEIAERLQVSKASVSTNARQMEVAGVLERCSHPGDRRDYYRVPDDIAARLLDRHLDRIRRLNQLLEEGARTDAAADARIGERFRRLEQFQACAAGSLEEAVRGLAVAPPAEEGEHAA
jgi:DNA-binding transcriptional regulator GbsR (MarR family)